MRPMNWLPACLTVGLVGIVLASPTQAAVIVVGSQPASAAATIGESTTSVPVTTSGKVFSVGPTPVSTSQGSMTISGSGNSDPFASYSITFDNNTAGLLNFDFNFAIPITPIFASNEFEEHISGTLTDRNGDGSVSISPFSNTFIQTTTFSENGGSTFTSTPFGVGPSASSNQPTASYGPFSVGPEQGPVPISFFNFMKIDVNLQLSAGDEVTLNGEASIQNPEPGSIVYLAWIGAAAVGAGWRRRKARLALKADLGTPES